MRATAFQDRFDAGTTLATHLAAYAGRNDVVVLALPRGGVPVGFEVAKALQAPLDVFLVRKLGVPGREELAMGAIASGGVQVVNDDVVEALDVPPERLAAVAAAEEQELERRLRAYRSDMPPPDVKGKIAILVDDGLATGSSMRAAVQALRRLDPARVVVAVPTAAAETCERLAVEADEVVCASTPRPFHAVGLSYRDFAQTTDAEVSDLLRRAASGAAGPGPPATRS
ncbi:MAG TPA: phosphoribosyltransferase family protein [Acidimicrobiales bacterium]